MIRGILSRSLWYFLGNGSSRLLTLVVLILAGRALGPEEYGVFSGLLGLSLFLTSLAELGLTPWAIREISREPAREHHILNIVLTLTASTSVLLLLGSGLVSALLTALTGPLMLILWFGCCTLICNVLTTSLIVRESPRQVTFLAIAEKALLLSLLIAFEATSDLTIWAIGSSYAVAGTMRLAATMVLIGQTAGWQPKPAAFPEVVSATKEAWPFGLTQAIYGMGGRLDVVFLALISTTAAGIFSSAFRLIEASFLITQSLTLAVMPMAVRAQSRSVREFRNICILALAVAAVSSLPPAIAFSAGSKAFIETVYGADFAEGAMVLTITAWCLPFAFVNTVGAALLNAAGLERRVYRLAFAGQAVRLIGVTGLAALLGVTGAAVGVVAGAVVAFGGYVYVLRQALWPPAAGELPAIERATAGDLRTSPIPSLYAEADNSSRKIA